MLPRVNRLPQPNEYGDYFLAASGDISDRPAIFPSKDKVHPVGSASDEFDIVPNGTWILTFAGDRGFVFDGGNFRRFPSAEAALDFYNANR